MPLPAGGMGRRPVGADGRVSEEGSLGEASRSCGDWAGEGIAPGAASWVSLDLPTGRYELICNLPGHYAMGMFTGLNVR
jgi:Sulfocyanin (SoxE) domain